MKHPWALAIVLLGISAWSAVAGDSIYGRITAVHSGRIVVLNYGQGEFRSLQRVASMFLRELRRARRTHARSSRNCFLPRTGGCSSAARAEQQIMGTCTPTIPPRESSMAWSCSGPAWPGVANYNDKTGTMAAAEKEAQSARRGLWATPQIR